MNTKQIKFLKIMNNNLRLGKITNDEYNSNTTLKNLLKIKNDESVKERKIMSKMRSYFTKWGVFLIILMMINGCSKSVDIALTPINKDSLIYYNGVNKQDSVWQMYRDTVNGKVISDVNITDTIYETVCALYFTMNGRSTCTGGYITNSVIKKYTLETIKYDSIDYNLPVCYQPIELKTSKHYTIIDYLKNYNGKDSIGTIFKKEIFRWKL